MDKQIVKDDWNPPINVCSKDVLILVIDGDHTSLAVIGGILRSWKYNVETVRNGGEALTILRTKTDKKFDLVVTDIHMPDMNGFELLRCISADFQVPIVMMSSDDSEGTMAKGLECGAAYFMRKPVCPDDLQNLWLYAIPKRDEDSSNQIVIQDTNTLKNLGNKIIDINQDAGSSAHFTKITSQVPLPIIQYINPATAPTEKYYDEIRRRRKLSNWNQKPMANTSVVPQSYSSSVFTNKKQKVAWTTGLHNKFLDALKIIGLDRAVPKKILEVMNVPGLTRENVASHLQKYRIFLKRVADIAERVDGMTKTSRSKFALNYLPLQSGFNLENLDTADENLLRKKLKQELRAMRDPLSTTPSWRHRGTMLVSNNVGTSKISFSNSKYPTFPLEPDNQISGEGSVEFSATSSTNNSMLGSSRVKEIMYQGHTALDNASGNITTANSQIVTNQRPSAFVQYGMNINGSEVHTGGLVNNLVTQGTNNPGQVTFGNYGIMQNEPSHPLELTNVNHEAGNGYMYAMSSNLENPGFQADFSEYLIQQLGGSGDQTVNSLEQGGSVGNPFLALGNHSVQTQLQNKNQETEPISNRKFGEESNLSNNRSREGSYFGEDFNPWFDQEPLQTQAGIPNANIHIADELYAVYQGCQGNAVDSSDISSSKKSSGPKE